MVSVSTWTSPEIDARIAAIRENLRELVEQAAAYSGAADDELVSRRIADQEARSIAGDRKFVSERVEGIEDPIGS